ncbi:hypothetical protein NC653_022064 [Populus alba x Populus x berolinensis]|uniref:Uncharacterized protein n=1 Tax=Populus alba x Populus x berolinensis TaxID=444605 RepID=A0AAD6QFF8_9ROSI|nr:hypothetical protein NC653_022064 [Populus alba x Populus x berolinensis]
MPNLTIPASQHGASLLDTIALDLFKVIHPPSSQDVLTIGLAYPDSPSSTLLAPDSEVVALLPKTLIPLATANVVLATSAGLGRYQAIMAYRNLEDLIGARSLRAIAVVTPPSTRMALGSFESASLMTTTLTSSPPTRTWEANRRRKKAKLPGDAISDLHILPSNLADSSGFDFFGNKKLGSPSSTSKDRSPPKCVGLMP